MSGTGRSRGRLDKRIAVSSDAFERVGGGVKGSTGETSDSIYLKLRGLRGALLIGQRMKSIESE